METVRIEDRFKATEFTGELVARHSSNKGSDPRWVDFEVWELEGGGFLLHRSGMSNIYHRMQAGPECMTARGAPKGSTTKVDSLPDEALRCPVCQPPYPDDLGDDERIRYEFPRHTFDRCATPQDVIRRLAERKPRGGPARSELSAPAAELIRKAAQRDERFAVKAEERIS